MRLIALDPGKTTGYCVLDTPMTVAELGEIKGSQPTDQRILSLIESQRPDEVVVEAFRLYPWKAQELSLSDLLPIRLIGAIKLCCAAHKVGYAEQPASNKTFFSEKLLKSVGLYKPGMPHAMDALRHALRRAWFHYGYKDEEAVLHALREYSERH